MIYRSCQKYCCHELLIPNPRIILQLSFLIAFWSLHFPLISSVIWSLLNHCFLNLLLLHSNGDFCIMDWSRLYAFDCYFSSFERIFLVSFNCWCENCPHPGLKVSFLLHVRPLKLGIIMILQILYRFKIKLNLWLTAPKGAKPVN